jgi:hypothetical protein
VVVPCVTIGEPIGSMNGVMDPGIASDKTAENAALTPGIELTFPVIEGDPAYNGFRPCIGFIVFKLIRIDRKGGKNGQDITFAGTLIKSLDRGDNPPGVPDPAAGLENFTDGTVNLMQ